MPKVISRSTIVTDTDYEADQERKKVHVYYCICKKLVLASTVEISSLRRRQVDNAMFMPAGSKYKLSSKAGATVCLQRPGGKERQHRSVCVNCGLLLAYRCHKKSDDVYLVNGAFLMQDEDSGVSRLNKLPATGSDLIQKKPVESSSTAMSAQQEEMMADKNELDANYDSNARVIQMMLNRDNGNKRGAAEPVAAAQPSKVRRMGTLLS